MARRAIKNRPFVDNYPPLSEWLHKHKARCQHQLAIGDSENPVAYLEVYLIKGQQCVVLVHADKHGWNLFTPEPHGKVTDALHDAELRLGLAGEE